MANRNKPENKKSTAEIKVRCTPEFKARIEALVAAEQTTTSDLIRGLLEPRLAVYERSLAKG